MQWMLLGLRLFGAAVLAALLLFFVDVGRLWQTLAHTDPYCFAAAAAINLPLVVCKAERWRQILAALDLTYPPRRAWIAFLASLAMGLVTPGRIGEVTRVLYLKADVGANPAVALVSVVMDRLLDLVTLAMVGLAALAVWQLRWRIPLWAWGILGPLAAGPLLLAIPSVRRRLAQWMTRQRKDVEKGTASRRFDLAGALADSMVRMSGPAGRKAMAMGLGLSGVAFAVVAVQAWLLSAALGLGLRFAEVALMLGLANLVGSLPLSVAGVGTRDAVFVLLMGARGIPAESALALGASFLVCNVGVCFLLGLLAWEIWPPVRRDDARFPHSGAER